MIRVTRCGVGFLVVLFIMIGTAWGAEGQDKYWPTCPAPELGAPPQAIGGTLVEQFSDIVWNGRDFAVVWSDNVDHDLHFRRFFADGTPVGDIVTVSTLSASSYYSPSLVWNGSGYGVAWSVTASGQYLAHFARLNLSGQIIGSEVLLTDASVNSLNLDLAWSGSGYAVVWHDNRDNPTTGFDIFATMLDTNGVITDSNVVLCSEIYAQRYAHIAYVTATGLYVVAWHDNRSSTDYEIWGGTLTQAGTFTASPSAYASFPGIKAWNVSLATTGLSALLVWDENTEADSDVFCKWITADGQVSDPASYIQLTSELTKSYKPCAVSTGVEYGVFWTDTRLGGEDIWFQRVDTYGAAIGSAEQITFSMSQSFPTATFGKYGYAFTTNVMGAANYIQPLVCTHDTTPPTCPGNLVVYAVTGTSAIVAWGPSSDQETDLASYIVYRNDWEIARTSATLYADTGLTVGATYNYMVQPVNAVKLQNTECTESLYVKTNVSLLLTVNKNSTDALLTWTDETMNNYNVFRGTNPQVMSLLGSTPDLEYDDPNILLNNVNYFYTVDDPGW